MAEGEVAEFDFSLHVCNRGSAFAVEYVLFGMEQLVNTLKRCASARGHVNDFGDRHNRPNDRCKVTDELHQLSNVKRLVPNKVAAVAENNANNRLYKQGDRNAEQGREARVVHVGVLVFGVQLFKRPKLLCFLYKCLNDGNAGEAFLREIRKGRECCLALVPFFHHIFTNDERNEQHKDHGNEREQSQELVYLNHFENGEAAKEQSIGKHHSTPAECFLNGVKVVGEQGHQVANLVDLVVVLREVLAMVKQAQAQICLQTNACTKKADAPCKSTNNQGEHNQHHGLADVIEHKVKVER